MLLNSWKEIAEYLKCGVRTAQRWHRDLHLPINRVRCGKRGPVIAHSENLDKWIKGRSSLVKHEKVQRQSSSVRERAMREWERAMREWSNFLWLELDTGKNFASLAKTSKNASTLARRRQAARKAYDTLQHLLSRKTSLPKSDLKDFHEQLRQFRRELEQLGEVFDL